MKMPQKIKGLFFYVVNPKDLTIKLRNVLQRKEKTDVCTNHEIFKIDKNHKKSALKDRFNPFKGKLYMFRTEQEATAFLHSLICK